jgi:hypothetical protein
MRRYVFIFKANIDGIVKLESFVSPDAINDSYAVSTFEQACEVAKQVVTEGVTSIELCGAFQEKGKQMVVDAIACDVPVGYIAFTSSEKGKHDRLRAQNNAHSQKQ